MFVRILAVLFIFLEKYFILGMQPRCVNQHIEGNCRYLNLRVMPQPHASKGATKSATNESSRGKFGCTLFSKSQCYFSYLHSRKSQHGFASNKKVTLQIVTSVANYDLVEVVRVPRLSLLKYVSAPLGC